MTDSTNPTTDERILALSDFLQEAPDDISESSHSANSFDAPGAEWLVLTDEESNRAVIEYIKESAWAFNASFLAEQTELPEEMFTALQPQCEGANEAFLKVIESTCGVETFADDAVSADGRGHFLSGYDGEEQEIYTPSGERLYAYRTN